MSKFFRGIILLLAVSSGVQAQLKQLTMEDAILNVNTKLAPDNLSQLGWIKNTNSYYYVDNDCPIRYCSPVMMVWCAMKN